MALNQVGKISNKKNKSVKRTIYILVLQIYLTLPFWLQAQGLIIPSGGYVIANNGNIVVSKNWTNNGSFTHNGGTVIFV
jgi:hypothetical protein